MATSYAIDAHSLIWYIGNNPRLGSAARTAMSDPDCSLYLPIIALAEAAHVVIRGRTAIPTVADLLRDIDGDPRIVVVPLDRAIFNRSLLLTAVPEMHDRLIVATTLQLSSPGTQLSLITCDREITASGLVPVTW